MALREWVRPIVAGAATATIAGLLAWRAFESQKEYDAKAAAAGATPGVDWWNPFSWGNLPRELGEDIELKRVQIVIVLEQALMWATVLIGSAATLWLIWRDVVVTPEQKMEEARRQAVLLQAATAGATMGATGGAPAVVRASPLPATGNPTGLPPAEVNAELAEQKAEADKG